VGSAVRVEFDGQAVLRREEKQHDIVGFLHTHPNSAAVPSRRDVATMQAWVSSFGKPLLCLIEGSEGLSGYVFDSDTSQGEALTQVKLLPRGTLFASLTPDP
jgi:hypothetical protein